MKIGVIGLGIMGSRMAANLLKKGHELRVYNRTKQKAEQLISNGAAAPLANVTKELCALAVKSGFGEQDFAALYRFLGRTS